MEKEIEIDGEKIDLKKSKWFGWGVVNPIKLEGKINWKNLIAGGSYLKLGIVAFIILVILGFFWEYATIYKLYDLCQAAKYPIWGNFTG